LALRAWTEDSKARRHGHATEGRYTDAPISTDLSSPGFFRFELVHLEKEDDAPKFTHPEHSGWSWNTLIAKGDPVEWILTRIIQEGFYCNCEYAATTSLAVVSSQPGWQARPS
jgi:hypothetical protein